MDVYFSRMKELTESPNVNLRMQFMLQVRISCLNDCGSQSAYDVFCRSSSNWASASGFLGPRTGTSILDEVPLAYATADGTAM